MSSISRQAPLIRPQHANSYVKRAQKLITSVDNDPWGSVLPSVYETSRVASWTPWLEGHERRLAWLLDQQSADGSWGEGPAPYRLLPTLGVTEALLSTLRQDTAPGVSRERLAAAVANGLAALRDLSRSGAWPDTAAIEILVPDLVVLIHEHLDQPEVAALSRLGPWSRGQRLTQPRGFQAALPDRVAEQCRVAGAVPPKLHHTFEGVARRLPKMVPAVPGGLLGSSPAATAAWLATGPDADREKAVTALTAVAERYTGLFPEATPISVFERLWVAAALARPGLPATCVATVRAWAAEIYDTTGVRGAPGLPPDTDDTAMAVLVSALAGSPRDPSPLSAFEAGDHYDCYVGEDTGSSTANAHALQALTAWLSHRPTTGNALQARMDLTRDWLLGQQQPDGSWCDKWHASPYYATQRCVTALSGHTAPTTRNAVRSAADWVLATQHDDGSWGVWGGTAEETAYAVQILLSSTDHTGTQALERAEHTLREAVHSSHHPALWHDKSLYAPHAVVRAEVTAALNLLQTHQP
ncbi:prenyltransferase/squalene oxidase repeat-containing protein [Streptomyces sp. NRRL S-813]|uniref:prenyltransferase/squalene oxidase repeat-containing protein n=1 Tax=Streptomyces sp. NRRL S-813 TaxID=1463919 RepID=UPI00068AF5E4|nr:prenyltransferase/squalene oxidase repeat-containing protein [Streptomyces sp. NRRL S-813]